MLTFAIGAAAVAVLFAIVVWLEREPRQTIDGYEHADLVEVVFQKTKAYRADKPWPAVAEASTVLDFGGGCGIHYKQANSPTVRWAVVELPATVKRARELATDRLQFFTDISEAQRWLGDVDVMHSNGALQYSNDPVGILKQLCAVRAKTMFWTRLRLAEEATERELQSSRLRDNGPGKMRVEDKTVRYEMTRIPERDFLAAHTGYDLAERGDDWFRFVMSADY